MREVRLEEAGTFEALLDVRERVVSYGIGPDGEAFGFAVPPVEVDMPFSLLWKRPSRGSVLRLSASGAERTALDGQWIAPPFVQPLPSGDLLLVEGRRRHEPRAAVYGPDGALRREFDLEIGINDVQVASDGRTWVSYDDEAVFKAGSAGLIRLSSDGGVEWTYKTPAGAGAIYDCELLNVATDAVWACYWDNYPVVRIDPDDSIAWWTSPRNAPGALAVGDRWFAMYLSYGDCALLELDEYRLLERELVKLVLPSGTPLETQQLIGRGSFLHLFDGPHWYRIDVETIRDN